MSDPPFAPSFKDATDYLGVRRAKALEVRRSPDQEHNVMFDDLVVRITVKRLNDVTPPKYLLVWETAQPVPEIHFAVPLPTDFVSDMDQRTPLELLELVVDRFGRDVDVGGERRKFFLETDIPAPVGKSTPLFGVPGFGPMPRLYMGLFVKPMGDVMRCALGFCLDVSRCPKLYG